MDTPREPGELSPSRMWFGRNVRHPMWYTPHEVSPADSLVAAQEAFIRRKETSKGYNPSNPSFSRTHRPLDLFQGQHVLVQSKDSREYSIPAVVMQLSNSGRAARVRRTDTGEFMLRNRKGIRIDGDYLKSVLSFPQKVHASGAAAKSKGPPRPISFADQAEVASFQTIGWKDELGDMRRIGVGHVTPEPSIPTFFADLRPTTAPQESPGADAEANITGSRTPEQAATTGPAHASARSEAPPNVALSQEQPPPEDVFLPRFALTENGLPLQAPGDLHRDVLSGAAHLGLHSGGPQEEWRQRKAPSGDQAIHSPSSQEASHHAGGQRQLRGVVPVLEERGEEHQPQGLLQHGHHHGQRGHDGERNQDRANPNVARPHPRGGSLRLNVRRRPLPPQGFVPVQTAGPPTPSGPGRSTRPSPPTSSTYRWSSNLFQDVASPHLRTFPSPCPVTTLPPGAGHHKARFPGATGGTSGWCRRGPTERPPTITNNGAATVLPRPCIGPLPPCTGQQGRTDSAVLTRGGARGRRPPPITLRRSPRLSAGQRP